MSVAAGDFLGRLWAQYGQARHLLDKLDVLPGVAEYELIAEGDRIALEQLASSCKVAGLPEGL